MVVMSDKLSIKEEMRAIDNRTRSWYKSLTAEERAKYDKQLWVQMRYASSVNGSNAAQYLMLVNEFVNVNFNALKHHPQLQHYLLQLAGSGKTEFHPWIQPGKGVVKNKFMIWLSNQYPGYSDEELDLLVKTNGKEVFIDIMEQQGMTKKEIKELVK
jgi:hypothetical protein